ncbi:MAG: right-handed parallel beta-helix repeat-containing protein [Promethearchaeota archaeon]
MIPFQETSPASYSIPLIFQNNSDIVDFCSGNGTDGTASNPHVIQNITFFYNNYFDYMVQIRNTDLYIIIRNCTFDGNGTITFSQLFLQNATNVRVENCTFISSVSNNVAVFSSTNFTAINNTISEGYWGVRAYMSNNLNVTGNEMEALTGAIYLDGCNNTNIVTNNATNCSIFLDANYSENITGINNTCINVTTFLPFEVYDSSILSQNFSGNNSLNGKPIIYLFKESNRTIVYPPDSPIYVINCTNITINSGQLNIQSTAFSSHTTTGLILQNMTFKNDSSIIMYNTNHTEINSCHFNNSNQHLSFFLCNDLTIENSALILNYITYFSSCENITLKNSSITGNLNATFVYGAYFHHSNNTSIENCTFENLVGYGVYSYYHGGEKGLQLLNCTFDSTLYGIYEYRSNSTIIENNTFFNVSNPINLYRVNDTTIRNNRISSAGGYGIQCNNGINVTIENCTLIDIPNSWSGVDIRGFEYASISHCNFTNVGSEYTYFKTVYLHDVSNGSFTSNVVENCSVGIFLGDCSKFTVNGNNFTNVQRNGINIYSSSRINITNNMVECNQNGTSGIELYDSRYVKIENNEIIDPYQGIYLIDSRSCEIVMNNITGCSFGMYLWNSKENLMDQLRFEDIDHTAVVFISSRYNNLTNSFFINVQACVSEDKNSYENTFLNNDNCNYKGHGAPSPYNIPLIIGLSIGLGAGIPLFLFTYHQVSFNRKKRILAKFKDGLVSKKVVLKLNRISKKYVLGKEIVQALNNVSLEIERGGFISIMGPSGSGKTTLLNIIGTIDSPTSGEMFLNGKPIFTDDVVTRKGKSKISSKKGKRELKPRRTINLTKELELANIRRLQVGMIFQHYNLIEVLTSLENIVLPMTILNIPEEEKREKARELLKLVGLEGKEERLPSQLSGGEQQRVSIARALANDPVIILADEPTGNLDQETGRQIMKLFERLNSERGQTFLIVTHDPVVASRTHRIIKIKDGKIIT